MVVAGSAALPPPPLLLLVALCSGLPLAATEPTAQASSRSSGAKVCSEEVLRSVCDRAAAGNRLPVDCDVCAGQHQHLLRRAGCSGADVAAWCNAPAGAAAAVVSVCKVELLWQRITTAGHNSCPGNAVPCASGVASTRASMSRAAALGFTVMRFGASGFWPPDQKLFVDESTRPQFLAALDSVFDDAKALGVRLIPSLQWNHWAFADVCNGTLGGDMMRDPDSCAQRGSQQFISTVVGRYSGAGSQYRDVVYAWELGNELNLLVDIDHANQTVGCAPLLGTPQHRTSADNFSTADLVSYQSAVAGWVRRAAAPHAVLISSGHAIPRPAAKHLAHSYHKRQTDWTKDTEGELVEVLQLFHTGLDLISVHIYPGPAACVADPSSAKCENYRFGQPPRYLLQVAAKAAEASGKALYLGEFGLSLPDRRDPSSPIYNFTEQMLGAAQNAGAMLATIWAWEDSNQVQTYGLFPANETDRNDARTIRALQAAAVTPQPPMTLTSCTARSLQQLELCARRVSGPNPGALTIEGTIACSPLSAQDTNHGCLDLRRPSQGVQTVPSLWVAGAAVGAKLFRSNYSHPVLSVGGSSPLLITGLTLEDTPWLPGTPHGASCFPRLAPPYQTQPMVKIYRASSVVFRNVSFIRGFHIAVSIVDSHSVVFSDNLWLESNTFGVSAWANPEGYATDVHFFGNRFMNGQNNAIIGTLSNSILQGNEFVHNHHIACFNASGGQLDILQPPRPNHNLTLSANRVVDGSIDGGDGDWQDKSTYAFEINPGIHAYLLHNDAVNNSGWSIFPNNKGPPESDWKPQETLGGANVTLEANRLCSQCLCGPHFPSLCKPGKTFTVCGARPRMEGSGDYCNTTEAAWLHRASPKRGCEAQQVSPGSVCGVTDCAPPVRPRGSWVTPFGGVVARDCELSWWVADLDPKSVRVLRKFVVSDVPPPIPVPGSLRGQGGVGKTQIDGVPSITDGGEVLALWANGYGVLDVMMVASEETSFDTGPPPGPGPLRISKVYVDGNDVRRAVFVDTPSPTFSWELDCRSKGAPADAASVACPRGTAQGLHRLQIFSARTKTLVVDSGVIDGPVPSLTLRHQGLKLLKASTRYTFELSVWAFRDKGQSHSGAAHVTAHGQFHTALFSPAEWSAEWISGGTMLRSSPFSAKKNMISASLLASGIGCFSLTINGQNVDTAYPTSRMDPGFSTAPRARLLYRAYDVLPLLNGSDGSGGGSGNSTAAYFVIGVRLGFCKYGFLYNECEGAHAAHAKCRAISLQLTMSYADGSKQTVQTNTNANGSSDDVAWTATTTANPTRYTHLYHGEIFDARLEQPGWDTFANAADTTAWQPAIAYPNPEKSRLDVLSLHKFPPMGVATVVAPVKSWMVADNTSTRLLRRVFDFGNNYAGVTEVAVTGGAPGAILTMRHTEIADDDDGRTGPVVNSFYIQNGKNCFDRVLIDGNCANQTDQLVLGTGASSSTSQPQLLLIEAFTCLVKWH
jgi:hypothetical protein